MNLVLIGIIIFVIVYLFLNWFTRTSSKKIALFIKKIVVYLSLIIAAIFTIGGKFLFSLPISDILYTYVLGETFKIKKINLKSKNFTFCVELPIKSLRAGLNLTTSPSYERKRIAGKKKVNALKDGYLILQEMIKLFFYIKK